MKLAFESNLQFQPVHYPHYGNQGGEPSSIIRLGNWKLIHYYEDVHEEFYNMRTDFVESKEVAADNPELVKQLSEKLFVMLNEMGARFPTKDPEWNSEKEKEYLERVVNNRWPNLEKQRMNFLSKDFDPRNNWWGSRVTND